MSKELEALRQLHMAGAYVSESLRNKITPSKATELKNVLYQAIKRNEPMKVINVTTVNGVCLDYECPSCKQEIDNSGYSKDQYYLIKHCISCGQKLDWSDEK